jgi:DNA-binding HxlR family transcriptional regulator
MHDWWSEIDDEVLDCLREGRKSTREIGRRLGMSSAALSSVLLMLAAEGRVRVNSVELVEAE